MDYDFSFFLVVATVATGLAWGGYALLVKFSASDQPAPAEPFLVETARSFFPILLIVLLIRSFIAEPFRIPSGSMMPTLLVGDFILVNKFTYGIKLPITPHTNIIALNKPQRGDIVVFRFPNNPQVDYIKRVVGLPGDRVGYHNKQLIINGKPVKQVALGSYRGVGQGKNMTGAAHFVEQLAGVDHGILVKSERLAVTGVYTVPAEHYFVLGDNRDGSNDSRYWGTVPAQNLVGKAFLIWMNWDWQHKGIDFDRIGTLLH